MASPLSTIAELGPEDHHALLKRRTLYTITTVALSALMLLAVTDALGWTSAYGVRSRSAAAAGDGRTLRVVYPAVTRPALASPFRITVTDPAGFDDDVLIAVDRHYLEMWDVNGWYPEPSGEHSRGVDVVLEFDPPSGTTFTASFDARIEPAVQSSRSGHVTLLDADEQDVATVRFDTTVRP